MQLKSLRDRFYPLLKELYGMLSSELQKVIRFFFFFFFNLFLPSNYFHIHFSLFFTMLNSSADDRPGDDCKLPAKNGQTETGV